MSLFTFYKTKLRMYIMVLCIMYLLVMVIFHLDIQDSEAIIGQRPRFSVNNLTAPDVRASSTMMDVVPQSLPPHSPTPLKQPTNMFPALNARANNNIKPSGQIRHVVPKGTNSSLRMNCVGPDDGSEFQFVEVVKDTLFAFSAFWDTRPNDFDNRHNGSFIRIISIVRRMSRHPEVWCHFRLPSGETVTTPIQYYEMCENHGRPFGGYILSCRIPSQLSSQPCNVKLSSGASRESTGYAMKVTSLIPKESRNQFAVCVPPLYGNIDANKLTEFIELTRLLGAQRFTFYDYKISHDITKVLEYYRERGVVDVIRWDYPEHLEQATWYHGQLIAIQDCLYRNMESSEYLALNDLDEYVVPRVHSDWSHMMEAMFQRQQCAFQIPSAYFPPGGAINGSTLFGSKRRTERFSLGRTKCMVKPYWIFEMGIHHVSKPIWAYLDVKRMPDKVAFLHHYRTCMSDFAMNCKNYVNDDFMTKYATEVGRRLPKHLLKLK